ncbi:hypothetical protein HG530_007699 [Fusarium avenaceum]|nr:hypothetical protein HG530_007699 [Fusarium avenaceum]
MEYEPLDETNREIRLLSILPEELNEPRIKCILTTVSLKDLKSDYASLLGELPHQAGREERLAQWLKSKIRDPDLSSVSAPPIPQEGSYRFQWGDFATLSYTWGNPLNTEVVVINDNEVPVTVNLAAALRTLRRLEFFNGRFMLWADSVCINQADLEERNSQVAAMRDLYTSSWTTMAFLGTAADNSDKALALLKTLAVYEQNNTTNHLKNILQDNPAYLGGQGEWLALQAFLQRSYWSRLWIVQEVALAPSSMLMFAGDDSITWRQVQDALTSIHTCLWVERMAKYQAFGILQTFTM